MSSPPQTGNGGQVPNAYERGQKDAEVDAGLASHGDRLDKINGSIEKTADALLELQDVVRTQGERARLAAAELIAAAKALEKETETRRAALADTTAKGEQKFTRREKLFGAGISVLLLVVAIVGAVRAFG